MVNDASPLSSPPSPGRQRNCSVLTSGSCRSLRPRSCMRLRKILSQTQELPPRRKTCFSFVQARRSVVKPFVILGAPIALSYALFHNVRHRSLLRSDVRLECAPSPALIVVSQDGTLCFHMFPQEPYVKENNTTCCLFM